MDLSGLPMPADAPAPGRCVRIERKEGGLVRLVLDPPHRTHTVLDLPLIRDLDLALEEVERGGATLGVVITGRSALHFAFGADIDLIEQASDVAQVERAIKAVHAVFERLESLPLPTVAAVGGAVPGGAYELALACDHIVLADDPSSRIGLPETKLGILPAWGGTHRLTKRLGPAAALPLILQGRLVDARGALRRGMVDRIALPEHLPRVAAAVALGREKLKRKTRGVSGLLVDRNPLATKWIEKVARKQALKTTGGHYPAVDEVIELVGSAARTSVKAAAQKEARAGARLATGPVCKRLIGIFRASEAAKKLGKTAEGETLAPLRRAGVVGAGVMGGGIAGLFAEKGLEVRLADLDQGGLDRALFAHGQSVERKRRSKRLKPHEADAALDRLTAATGLTGFGRSEIVIEAIAETLPAKRGLFGEFAGLVSTDCILATNTSSLSVAEIAAGLPHPERIVGLHFFNPVAKMPLVEIVPHEGRDGGPGTAPEVVTRVAALALASGKTPVVVRDVAGFLVNRILGPFLDEALRLAEQGVNLERIDRVVREFGMPMGPFRLLDEVGFDIASHAAASLHAAYGARMEPSDALERWIRRGDLGKKTGRGFYAHDKGRGKEPQLVSAAPFHLHSQPVFSDQEIVDRCVLALCAEAVRCLEEGVVASAAELDLAAVFGTGFAPFRGGPLHYLDSLGASEVIDRLRTAREAKDVGARGEAAARFDAPTTLLDQAGSSGRFFA